MSLRRSLVPSFRAIHPALFLVGVAIGLVQAVLHLGGALLQSAVEPVYATVLTLVLPFLVFLLTVPLVVAIYVPVRDGTEQFGETLRTAARGVERYYVRVFAANVAAFPAAVAVALGGTAVTFVLATVAQYGRYAVLESGPPNVWLTTWGFPLSFVAFLVVGLLVTRFADVFVAFGDARPRSAWRSSLAFVRREPLSFLGYAAVFAVLNVTGQVFAFAFQSVDSAAGVVAAIGFVVLVSSVGLVLASALHVTYFDRTVEPVVRSAPARLTAWARVAVVGVVLLAAVAGAGYVRVADLGAGQDAIQDLPDDPHAAFPVAASNTANANHRYVLEMRNESDPDATFRTVRRSGADYDDRQRYVYVHGEDMVLGGFFGEGTMATLNGGSLSSRSSLAAISRSTGNWSVLAVPGYGLAAPSEYGEIEYGDVDWSIESRNESTVVYRVEDQERILDALGSSNAGSTRPLADESYLEVYVDREEAVVTGARYRLRSEETGNDFSYVARYEEVGTADLERPAAVGPRTPLEWVWDASYY